MLPDRVSNPGPLTYESGALPIALRGPAKLLINYRSKSNEILRIYQRIIIFSTHMNIFTITHNTSM